MSTVYDPNKIRGSVVMPPPGPGLVNLSGFAAGDFATPTPTNAQPINYTAVDGLGVHTVSRDTKGGALSIKLQYASLANVPLQALAKQQFEEGQPNVIVRGVITVIDPNTGWTTICTDGALSNNPMPAYADEQPVIEYIFTGKLSRIITPIPPLIFGPSSP